MEEQSRSVYLDNIRNFLVYNVVFFHAMLMFTYPLVFWWPVVDKAASSRAYEVFMLVSDASLMPHLIFIAMLFIFPSLEKRSAPGYIKKRFFRLMVPLLVFVFCAGEIYFHLILKRAEHLTNPQYSHLFLNYWRDFFSDFGLIFRNKQSPLEVHFSVSHAWFMSFLFTSTVIIVLLSRLKRSPKTIAQKIDGRNKIILKTFLISLLFTLLYVIGIIAMIRNGLDPNETIRLAGFFEIRLVLGMHLIFFIIFGLYVYKKEWLTSDDIGNWKFWGLLSLAFLVPLVLVLYYSYFPLIDEMLIIIDQMIFFGIIKPFPELTESFKQMALVYYMLQLWFCMSLLMFFLSFAKRFFNRSNNITSFCSKHSIYVYVLHLIPVMLLQYAFNDIAMPSIIKIMLITIIVIPACLWLSHRLVYPYPKIAIAFFVSLKLVALFAGFDFYYYALLGITFVSFAGAVVEGGKYFLTAKNVELDMSEAG